MENIFCNFNFQFAARSRVNYPLTKGQGRLTQTTFIQKNLHSNKQTPTCNHTTMKTNKDHHANTITMKTNKHQHANKQPPTFK